MPSQTANGTHLSTKTFLGAGIGMKHFWHSRTGRWKFYFRTGRNAISPEKPNSRISWLSLAICSKAFFSRLALTAFSSPFPKPKNVTWESKNKKDVMVGRLTTIEASATLCECTGEPAVAPDHGGITVSRGSTAHRPPRQVNGIVRPLHTRGKEQTT